MRAARKRIIKNRESVVIVGAGPAGLSAAIFAASEGLDTALVSYSLGGQANQGAFLENYLGFPGGITAAEITSAAVKQADKFGVRIICPAEAVRLRRVGGRKTVVLADHRKLIGDVIVLACGLQYGTLSAENLDEFYGRGVYYGMPSPEQEGEVCIVGGGNSAGTVALSCSRTSSVVMVVRGNSLGSMSSYLAKRVLANKQIQVLYSSELAAVRGSDRVEAIEVFSKGKSKAFTAQAVSVCIGGVPRTAWLSGAVVLDKKGYVMTGSRIPANKWSLKRRPLDYETSMAGVLAIGDVRHGSTKRFAAGVGDGAVVSEDIHEYLSAR